MKIAIGFIAVLVVLVGAVYGLARAHVLPLQGLAKSSPAAKNLLLSMKLIMPDAPKSKPKTLAAAIPDPLAAQKAQLAQEEAQVVAEKALLDRKIAATPSAPPAAPTPASPPITVTASKLVEIYEAMGSDDLATLFAKEPDSAVVSALIAMDSKKAAKALAALPSDRAAKITALMNQAMATAPNSQTPSTS